MDMGKTRVRSKVLESIALRNKITKNLEGINRAGMAKEDIALLKDTRVRSKVLESIALRNKITKNLEGINRAGMAKEDIALLKDVLEKIIDL
ncbi:hypothetical protein Glove_168g315 [Diversispora epigaea]|uniref:Uncharacterized protein n=1 Tax=Diversispora epigaea TaxID=1348612 RepID=A0A397IW33_9GLOM|nr:hypothetical protein Glove_168g315 [Diversispora epigaea]